MKPEMLDLNEAELLDFNGGDDDMFALGVAVAAGFLAGIAAAPALLVVAGVAGLAAAMSEP